MKKKAPSQEAPKQTALRRGGAPYRERILVTVSRESTVEPRHAYILRSFSRDLPFWQAFTDREIVSTSSTQLRWARYRSLHQLEDAATRSGYAKETAVERGSRLLIAGKNLATPSQELRRGHATHGNAALTLRKLSPAVRVLHPTAASHFKAAYILEFLALPSEHSEVDSHRSLLRDLVRSKLALPEKKVTKK